MAEIEYYRPDGSKWEHVHCMKVATDYWWIGFLWGFAGGAVTMFLGALVILSR